MKIVARYIPARVADGLHIREETRSIVSAVQDRGPAFFAGVQPGDWITVVDRMDYPNPEQLRQYIETRDQRSVHFYFGIAYLTNTQSVPQGRPYDTTDASVVEEAARPEAPWITTVIAHTKQPLFRQPLPGLEAARAEMAQEHERLREEIEGRISTDPCGTFEQMPQIERQFKRLQRMGGDYRTVSELPSQAKVACANKKEGSIPEFEALVVAMFSAQLDPCSYQPGSDQTSVLNRVRLRVSLKNYTSEVGIAIFNPRGPYWEERKVPCLIRFLEASLIGKTYVPSKKPPLPPPPVVKPSVPPSPPPLVITAQAQPVLVPPPSLPPPAPPKSVAEGPRSGRWSYSGPPVPQNGEVVIPGLPLGTLKLEYDSKSWAARISRTAAGEQNVILRSLKPGMQKTAQLAWSLE